MGIFLAMKAVVVIQHRKCTRRQDYWNGVVSTSENLLLRKSNKNTNKESQNQLSELWGEKKRLTPIWVLFTPGKELNPVKNSWPSHVLTYIFPSPSPHLCSGLEKVSLKTKIAMKIARLATTGWEKRGLEWFWTESPIPRELSLFDLCGYSLKTYTHRTCFIWPPLELSQGKQLFSYVFCQGKKKKKQLQLSNTIPAWGKNNNGSIQEA